MLLEQGWLVGARRVPSPHYDCRPDDETPTLLVVHNISLPPGEFGGPWIDALFTGTIDPQAHPFFTERLPHAMHVYRKEHTGLFHHHGESNSERRRANGRSQQRKDVPADQ